MLLPPNHVLHKPRHCRQRGRRDSLNSSLKGPCVDEENTADSMENRRHSHRLARQQVMCLASDVSPRRSGEGYEMANSSMAAVPV